MPKDLRTGLIGAGAICQFHVAAVKQLPSVELIGIVDLDRKRARANAEEWGTIALDSFDQIIDAGANVLHILTPPATHAKLALAALAKGCHVLIESPVTTDEAEARAIAKLARDRGLIATTNHALLYEPQIKRALALVRAGELGDVTSVEFVRGAAYPPYAGGALPPRYKEVGYPFRDLGVDGVYLVEELLGPIQHVAADWKALGGNPDLAYDEWHADLDCERGRGQIRVSHSLAPAQSQLIVHGTKRVVRVELFASYPGLRSSTPAPRPAERMVDAVATSIRPLIARPIGMWKSLRNEGQPPHGLRDLVDDFYRGLAAHEPPPVAIDDAAQTVKWVEQIARGAEAEHTARLATFPTAAKVPFLVTGAAGSLGKAIVKRLLGEGHKVRAFVRRFPDRPEPNVEYVFGNLGDPEAVDRAVAGAERVIHAGATMKGSWLAHTCGTIVGTENVVAACRLHRVKQLVHLSSMSVIDFAGSVGHAVDEDANLEPRAAERGSYTEAKLAAERLVVAAAAKGLPTVILRPGQIFGGGIPLITGAVARPAAGRWLVLGDGKLELPLVYIDDVVDAIMNAIAKQLTHGEVIQLVDPEHLTQGDVLDLAGAKQILRVPRPVVFALGKLSELPLRVLGRQSPIALYRLQSALASLHYESTRASTLLGWVPRIGVREGIRRVSSPPR